MIEFLRKFAYSTGHIQLGLWVWYRFHYVTGLQIFYQRSSFTELTSNWWIARDHRDKHIVIRRHPCAGIQICTNGYGIWWSKVQIHCRNNELIYDRLPQGLWKFNAVRSDLQCWSFASPQSRKFGTLAAPVIVMTSLSQFPSVGGIKLNFLKSRRTWHTPVRCTKNIVTMCIV